MKGVLSRDERHAIDHAKYLVERASPDNPEVGFGYTLVQDLLNVIDRATVEWPVSAPLDDDNCS